MLCILHDAHRVCVLGVRRQMVGQKSPALLAVFKKADKKGGDLRSVWGALKEEPCSWGNAQRQYRAWRAEQGVAPAAKTPAAKERGKTHQRSRWWLQACKWLSRGGSRPRLYSCTPAF